jgi:hypothetical protein
MTKLAKLIAQAEGFFKPGSLPQRRRNPGDLRHSPHSSHVGIDPDGIGIIPSAEDGWEDLERQLRIYAERGMTMRQMIAVYAPPNENNTTGYLERVCKGLQCGPDLPVSEALKQVA